MKHYTAEQWADFARGLVAGHSKSMMKKHLDSGCQRCAGEISLWQSVAQTAKRQEAIDPPAGVVRNAKALMGLQKLHAPAKPTAAKLLFDSMLAPAAAGARSAGTSWPRQLLFGVGDHRIDLRMEPRIDAEKVAIVGQVLDSANPDKMFSKIPVSLHFGEKLLAYSETNGFGEFELECDLIGRLELRATLPHGQLISVSLIEQTAQAGAFPYLSDSGVSRSDQKATKKKV
jgi:hypothetical protein